MSIKFALFVIHDTVSYFVFLRGLFDPLHLNLKRPILAQDFLEHLVTIRTSNMQTPTDEKKPLKKPGQTTVMEAEVVTAAHTHFTPKYKRMAGAKADYRFPETQGREDKSTNALDNEACLTKVQDTTPALPLTRIILKLIRDRETANQDNLSSLISTILPTIVLTITCFECWPHTSAVLMSELLHVHGKELEVALTKKLTYRVLLTYRVTVKTMRTAISLLNTGAGANYIQPSLIPNGPKNCMPWSSKPAYHHEIISSTRRISTSSPPPRRLTHPILVWNCSAPWFMHPSWHEVYRSFYPQTYPTWKKIVLWKLQPVVIVTCKPRNTEVNVVESGTTKARKSEQVIDDAQENFVVRVACQFIWNSNT